MKRAAPVLFAALLICTLTCPALAAEPAEGTPPPKQTAAFYPAEVRETAEGDARRLEKSIFSPPVTTRQAYPLPTLTGRAGTIPCWM